MFNSKPIFDSKMEVNRTCLLIDDDRDDQVIFSMALSKALPGIECQLANSGQEAITVLDKTPLSPDLIFLDLNMPAMDGLECLRQIRTLARLAATPIYIYSTTIDLRLRELAMRLGAAGCIEKPQRLRELVSILQKLLSGKGVH